MDHPLETAGRYGGRLSPAVAAVAITAAILRSETFAWSTSALSDLGTDPATAPLFNGGLVLAGLLALPLCAWRFDAARHRLERVGALAFAGAMLALAGVGLFPSDTALHLPSAVGFYLGFTYGLFLTGTGEALAGRRRRGLLTMWVGIAELSVWLGWAALDTPGGLAVPETIGALVVVAWVVRTTRRRRGR